MRMHLRHLLISLILLLLSVPLSVLEAQDIFTYEQDSPPNMQQMLNANEWFEYEVSYGFFTLGWIEVELMPDTTYQGRDVYHLKTTMRSNSRVPLIGTNIVEYENFFQFNEQYPYTLLFWRDDIHDEEFKRIKIEFDRDSSVVRFFERGEQVETLDLVEPASGGDIIFYYSRMFAGRTEPYELPVYIENELGYVSAESSPETEMREYEAFDEPVETFRSDGDADINGPFGFRGRFTSWFSTSDLRVPVEAHVKVIFGNVKVRLIDYERRGENISQN